MMFRYDPQTLHPYWAAKMERYGRFLSDKSVAEGAFWVGPETQAPAPDYIVSVVYRPSPDRKGGFLADLSWQTVSGRTEVHTDLGEALFMLAFAFDKPQNLELLTRIPADADPAQVLEWLDLPADTIRGRVAKYMPGSYVAPSGDGWLYYMVEYNGAIMEFTSATRPVPLLQMMKANYLQEEQRLADRLAEYLVPLDPEHSRDAI